MLLCSCFAFETPENGGNKEHSFIPLLSLACSFSLAFGLILRQIAIVLSWFDNGDMIENIRTCAVRWPECQKPMPKYGFALFEKTHSALQCVKPSVV